MTPDHTVFMRRALELARSAREKSGTSPIGAVLVLEGEILAEGFNQVGCDHDPTAHAEIVTLRRAGQRRGVSRFAGATLYSTLQPCGMCTMAMIWAGVKTIVYGAGREQVHAMYFEDQHFNVTDYLDDAYRDDMRLIGGVLADRCAALYYGPDDDPPREAMANLSPREGQRE